MKNGTLAISWGEYAGFYWHSKYSKRLCLGWIAFTYIPNDLDDLLNQKTTEDKGLCLCEQNAKGHIVSGWCREHKTDWL